VTAPTTGAFRALHTYNYRLWVGGALVSNIGAWMQRIAQDWLVLTELTHKNAAAVGVVVGLQFGPQLLLLPLTGYIHDSAWKDAATHPLKLYGLIDWPRIAVIMHQPASVKESIHSIFFACHKYLAYVLYVLFVLHVGGALKHQIFDREAELQRMIPAPRGAAKG